MPLNKFWKQIPLVLALTGLLAASLTGCLSMGAAEVSLEGKADIQEEAAGGEGAGDAFFIEVGIEPTPVPTSRIYSNREFGFQFSYPETWRLVEIDRGVEVWKGSAKLIIQAWWSSEGNPPVRWYGMPAGDLLYRDKQPFLGEIIPVSYLIFEERIKQILYNEGRVISAGDLRLLIYLESEKSDYRSIDMPEALIAEVKPILESFQVTGQAASPPELSGGICATEREQPPADWRLYRNEPYGFYLSYPPTMEAIETGEHTLEFHQGDLKLGIEFRQIDQAYPLPGFPAQGDVELTRFVSFFGDENPNPIVVESTDGMVTRISVGNTFGRTTPVQFQAVVTGPKGISIDLDQADSLLEILDYLCLIE